MEEKTRRFLSLDECASSLGCLLFGEGGIGGFCSVLCALRTGCFFKDLTKSRHFEALKVSSIMKSSKYRKGMLSLEKEWQQALALEKLTSSSLPISEVAGGAIAQSFKTIRKFYNRISGQASDATIHRIRIECKKNALPFGVFW